jgi:hypothetical protein
MRIGWYVFGALTVLSGLAFVHRFCFLTPQDAPSDVRGRDEGCRSVLRMTG